MSEKKNLEKWQLVEELHAPARIFHADVVIVYGYDDLWQTDVNEMRPYTQFNKDYHKGSHRYRYVE